jgi:hypothetical protein
MGLLDGDLQRVFGNAFGPRLLDAVIHHFPLSDTEGGGIAHTEPVDYPVKAMIDEKGTTIPGDVPASSVKIICLQYNSGVSPTEDDQITIRGVTYAINRITEDPAQAAWTFFGTPANILS